MSELQQIGPSTYLLPKKEGMRVPGLVIASEELLKEIEIDRPLEQVCNVAHLPGIVGYSIAMPDIHWGYGFPIGGVAAPIRSEEGQTYFASMAAAANFAFNNRQRILAGVRDAFHAVLRIDPRKVRLLYDVCHNIATFEEHDFEGKKTASTGKGRPGPSGREPRNSQLFFKLRASRSSFQGTWGAPAT